MNAQARDLKAYFLESRLYDDDRVDRLVRSERRAWRVAIGLAACVLLLAIAIAALAPLKSVMPPVVVEVDRTTGAVDVLTTLNGVKSVPAADIEQKYWLRQYVVAREEFVWEDRQANFRLVTLMSDPVEQNRYAKVVSAENPKSPQKELGADAVVEVQIKSITLGTNGGSATVRFTRQRRDLRTGAAVYKPQALVATITYSFVETTMPEADRLVNPRGFTVKRYQLDEELQ